MKRKTTAENGRVTTDAHLRWVPIDRMRVAEHAQRELDQARVDHICAELDLNQLGNPILSDRGETFHILDGQTRIAALRQFGFETDKVQCWVYEGLSDADESETFLKKNDQKAVDAFSRFRIGVNAGRAVECDIDRIVRAQGLVVSRDGVPGGIRAVATLRKVYGRGGPHVLGRTLRVIRDAYGDAGLEAVVIDGVGMLCQRYNGQLDEGVAASALSTANGGVSGLVAAAEVTRRQTGQRKAFCVAATAVDVINRGKRGKSRLPDWWQS